MNAVDVYFGNDFNRSWKHTTSVCSVHTSQIRKKKLHFSFRRRGLENFLLIHTVSRRWSDRWKKVEEPLFSCYVFVRIPLKERIYAIQTHGVVHMVSFNGVPSPIRDQEMNVLKKILEESDSVENTDFLMSGQPVEVVRGPFAGIQGRLNRIQETNNDLNWN